ncbi:MAG: glycine--tRNA ligase subunit beta [Acidobacteriota bacterium]
MKNRYLFELGTEEIPASMIASAMEQLKSLLVTGLQENQLSWENIKTWSTPRRLAVLVEGLPEKQETQEEIHTGPPASVAFDNDGKPTRAAEGFARKLGVPVASLEKVYTDKGTYVSVRRLLNGRETPEILSELMPSIINSFHWPKNMYWTESRFRFIRPLRWLTSLWNDQVLPFSFEGLTADRKSRGHRFLGRIEFDIDRAENYSALLRDNFVIADPQERKKIITEGLSRESGQIDLVADDALLETVVQLNEYPSVLLGEFDREFLKIPGEVLVTVMRFHQKYFSLVDKTGALAPCFLAVINTDGDPTGEIRSGHEKVLQARLEDGAFFWKTDQNTKLEDRTSALGSVLFQEKLGSYLDKTERIKKICGALDNSSELATAALLSKADLTAEMVRELPELQGIMGGLYAREEGYSDDIWKAIYEHYQPVTLEDTVPESRNGKLLSIADRLDTLVGCFSVDILPSGSSDPFGLRRQAQGFVMVLKSLRLDISVDRLISIALDNFQGSTKNTAETTRQLKDFINQRIQFLLQRDGISLDVVRAVLAAGTTSVHDVWDRAVALHQIRTEPDFEALAAAFKRSRNILAEENTSTQVQEDLFEEEAEKELYYKYSEIDPVIYALVGRQEYLEALKTIASIRNSVDRFFDEVMVMVEDQEIRNNRLTLLRTITEKVLSIADISEISH